MKYYYVIAEFDLKTANILIAITLQAWIDIDLESILHDALS